MKNKVVIITGASSGIGKALAEIFGRAGAKIVITGRNETNLQETSRLLSSQGIENFPIVADVSIEKDNQRMVDETIRKYGQIDVLINNAGISMRSLFEDVDLDVIRKVMDINFYGTVYATKYCLPYLLKSKGSVVGISSIAGFRGLPARAGYSASKFAVNGFLEVLRTEMLHKGVHVLTASPGFTASNIRNTALTSDGSVQGESPREEEKMMSAEECAEHILKAVQKRKKYLILTRQGKLTVFLNKWFPGWMDKIVYNVMAKEKDSPFKKA
ncbi:SDR family oxidoreductase [Xanthocytophaga agilis]|uniref:SDR family oxidoreductase n=1 Tax=Xanthocytophaga agilis TaxID=3048010 RepID=A0AAE3R4B5_9BACT|nr:SDR family oxidoreductase [Xanthocytophaga agilis]MDJ1501144.1 SDR family oxidoreductase [Xanthocytophaga agilis]